MKLSRQKAIRRDRELVAVLCLRAYLKKYSQGIPKGRQLDTEDSSPSKRFV